VQGGSQWIRTGTPEKAVGDDKAALFLLSDQKSIL